MNIIKKRIYEENGGSLVEFAIISPLLFLILFGIIEFGLIMFDKAVITNASREGARAGIVYDDPRPTAEYIEGKVKEYEPYLVSFAAGASMNVSVTPGSGEGDPLIVNVTYPYQFLVLGGLSNLLGGSIDGTINLSAETIMRME